MGTQHSTDITISKELETLKTKIQNMLKTYNGKAVGVGDASHIGMARRLSIELTRAESALIVCAVSLIFMKQLSTVGTFAPEQVQANAFLP